MHGTMTFSAARTTEAAPRTPPVRPDRQRQPGSDEPSRPSRGRRLRRVVVRTLVAVAGLPITAMFVALALLPAFGMRTMIVLSGSMVPTFATGDAVVVAEVDPEDVAVGDVITYAGYGTDRLTTHRVIGLREVDGRLHYRTQGDANPDPDPNLAPAEGLYGEVRLAVPGLGRALQPMMTRTGKLVVLGLPATILVGVQLRALSRSAFAGRSRNLRAIVVAVVLLAAATVAGVAIARTLATYTSAAQAAGNTFATSTFGSA